MGKAGVGATESGHNLAGSLETIKCSKEFSENNIYKTFETKHVTEL